MFAFLYVPTSSEDVRPVLGGIAGDFSPRFEWHGPRGIAIDLRGLERMFTHAPRPGGAPAAANRSRPWSVWETIGEELKRACTERGLRVQIGVAWAWTAAAVLAHARPGLTVAVRGREAPLLASIRIEVLRPCVEALGMPGDDLHTFERWGLRTLGELTAISAADLAARLGRSAAAWHAMACGEDRRPLMPAAADERFDASIELEWPIDGLEPLSFVLTRLLEPLSTRLERRDRGAAVLHVRLGLAVPRSAKAPDTDGVRVDIHARRLELPAPMRDVRTLRTLALLDLESHPPDAPIESVTVVIEPTPGRIVQHMLFTRAQPTPERVSTLLARLAALIGQDRIGAPATIDGYRPGAFAMKPFMVPTASQPASAPVPTAPRAPTLVSSLRRCRQPVPARVVAEEGRPVRVATDRRGFAGGPVLAAAGPWRTSGAWWLIGQARPAGQAAPPALPVPSALPATTEAGWDRDEWDVALGDGGVYRIFRDRVTDGWFIDAIVD